MNYLDAHKICSTYVDILANNTGLFLPESLLHEQGIPSHDIIADAFVLLFAHHVLWTDFTQSEINNYHRLLSRLSSFVDDSFAAQHSKCFSTMQKARHSPTFRLFNKKEVQAAEIFLRNNSKIQLYDDSLVISHTKHMVQYKHEMYIPKMKELMEDENRISDSEYWRRLFNLIGDYSDEVYRISGIDSTKNDFYYFMSFEQMNAWVDDPNLTKYYSPYREYIRSQKDSWAMRK